MSYDCNKCLASAKGWTHVRGVFGVEMTLLGSNGCDEHWIALGYWIMQIHIPSQELTRALDVGR